jgi:putative transposase
MPNADDLPPKILLHRYLRSSNQERSFGMKKSKPTEEQIIGVLKQVEAGRTVKELARGLGVSEAQSTPGRASTGGMESARRAG